MYMLAIIVLIDEHPFQGLLVVRGRWDWVCLPIVTRDCMGVIYVYKRMEEQRSNEHTSSHELWLLLTLQYSVS